MFLITTWIFSFLIQGTLILGSDIHPGKHLTHTGKLEVGKEFSLACTQNTSNFNWWKDDKVISSEILAGNTKVLKFPKLSVIDIGNYTCKPSTPASNTSRTFEVVFHVPAILETDLGVTVAEGTEALLKCSTSGYPLEGNFRWELPRETDLTSGSIITERSMTNILSKVHLQNATRKYGGIYVCKYEDLSANITVKVTGAPTVTSFNVHVIGKSKIYVDWAIEDGNLPLKRLTLNYQHASSKEKVKVSNRTVGSYIIDKLTPNTDYTGFSLEVENSAGTEKSYQKHTFHTFHEDVQFIPAVAMKGTTSETVTLGWNIPQNLTTLYHFYKILVKEDLKTEIEYLANETPFMVEGLNPGTNYTFVVQACSNYTNTCDKPSNKVSGTTMDGISSSPKNVQVLCHLDHSTNEFVVYTTWDKPDDPRGSILEYTVILTGNSTYVGEDGQQIVERVGPLTKSVQAQRAEFVGQLPNTYVAVSVCAKTRTRMCGPPAGDSCSTPSSLPHQEELSKASWKTVYQKDRFYILMTIPHISHRNGSICCLRVIVVRLTHSGSLDSLQPPHLLKLQSYDEVHSSATGGAYVAELLEPGRSYNIMIGDGEPTSSERRAACPKCLGQLRNSASKRARELPNHKLNFPTVERSHKKRHSSSSEGVLTTDSDAIHDGPLDSTSTYTAYLEAIILNERNEPMKAQSKYLTPLKRSVKDEAGEDDSMLLGSVLLGTAVITLSIVFVTIVCLARVRKERQPQGFGLSHSIQYWCNRLRGQRGLQFTNPEEIPPIGKSDLVMAFVERHQDCDYGFQHEFELLPDRFMDRTYFESDKRENVAKNRYPDIKAFDQTRVVLSTQSDVPCSDYINANFVTGYKDKKKFICAQGPMESTINDWWRMIWEQRISLILMLTNIEEYNKAKCAKYWPSEGTSTYGDIVVGDCSETKCSVEYMVRRLKIRNSNLDSAKGGEKEREVMQMHYLMWKDFMAPEHPMGIIRFIKKFNEVYSPDVEPRPPVLIHCSAGVGRTGTLVALDILLSELEETGAVTIFNSICELRHQRNYLVQSLKQYVFIYRALMEVVQFGDTQIPISELKSIVEKHAAAQNGKSRLQLEFEKLSQVIEDRKPFLVGASEENRHRNRHENVIPYDKSRVILSPIPNANKEVCTYINASFIEGYDNSDQFIIAQDPLEATVGDFWRMIVEQSVRSIVMLSEVGEDACPRYWPEKDQETSHGFIRVKYMQSQSFPFYYRREFTLTNSRTQDAFLVTQFQYNGWPVGIDQVPESARGLVELIDTTFKHKDISDGHGPKVVHCSAGADRSCIYVALAILVQQMLSESTVDVFNVVRSLRAQRQGLFQNFAQYELLYRGLLTYSELHRSNGDV